MEKATIYRAISVPTALVGGGAGILAAAVFHFQSRKVIEGGPKNFLFLGCWLSALGLAALGNIYFLRADARRRGEKFVSAGMRAALRALCPSYLVAAALTFVCRETPAILPIPWMLLYGLGLLGTQHFAPRSIVLLGWAFLAAGLLALIGREPVANSMGSEGANGATLFFLGNLAMGVTFGGFHLIYAICAWPRGAEVRGRQAGAAEAGNAP
jgi:hypothetical protein